MGTFNCFKCFHSKVLIFPRFDGFEQMAFIVGTALSPVLFRCAGYEGAFRWAAAATGPVLT